MKPEEIEERAKKVIADRLCLLPSQDGANLTRDTTFESLQADSLDMVELTMALEEEFEVEIKDDEAEKLTTVGEALDLLQKALA